MTDDEYKEFLSFLFERYVRPRIPRVRSHLQHHMMDESHYHLDQAQRAGHVLRYIEAYCYDDDDVYRTFRFERLQQAVSDTRSSLEFCNRVTEEAGFLDAYEAHTREIVDGLQPHHLPAADKDILREMGSPNPELELRGLVYLAKGSAERLLRSVNELSVRTQLRQASERLAKADEEFRRPSKSQDASEVAEPQKKPRRWFKGLGHISQGVALSLANTALALGILKFPVSPETQTWGALASVATGIGTILNGVGDLRNE